MHLHTHTPCTHHATLRRLVFGSYHYLISYIDFFYLDRSWRRTESKARKTRRSKSVQRARKQQPRNVPRGKVRLTTVSVRYPD